MSNINDIPTFEAPKPDPELMRVPKITMKTRRRLERKYGIEVNRRLPRRLKKAARHVDFEVCDMQPMADVSADDRSVVMRLDEDYRVRVRPAGYPRTRQVQRVVALFRRKLGQAHRRAVSDMLRRQYLEQHPGMLTYGDSPHPAPPEVTEPGFVVMSREQIRRIASRCRPTACGPPARRHGRCSATTSA